MTPGPEPDFLAQAQRIHGYATEKGVILRLVGALAFNLHCPRYNYLQAAMGRVFTDIDFAARSDQTEGVRKVFKDLGWVEDTVVSTLYGSTRMVFNDPHSTLHSDVFYDKMEFCHDLPLRDRLQVDPLTIPLAELVVEKMQIVKINEKDLIDTIMLLREHPVGETDDETVNAPVIARMCAADWGLWRTLTMNLGKVVDVLAKYGALSPEDREHVAGQVDELLGYIERQPKPMAWKLRNRVGDRVKWYKDVDELG